MIRAVGLLSLGTCALLGFQTPCKQKPFRTTYAPALLVTGVWDATSECLPYVSRLVCTTQGKVVYRADPQVEFEFKKRPWPHVVPLQTGGYQVLLERNNRPSMNDLLLLTVAGGQVIRKQILPALNSPPRDVDGDGQLEYAGVRDYTEGLGDPTKSTYNPILLYELRPQGWCLDTSATKQVNQTVWGQFYGFKAKEKLVLKTSKKFATYLPNLE
jgi:hypothetical protein